MDYRIKGPWRDRFDWRVRCLFGFYHYGVWRYLRVGKLGVRLWEIK